MQKSYIPIWHHHTLATQIERIQLFFSTYFWKNQCASWFFSKTSLENNSKDLNKNPKIINSNDIPSIINENLNALEDTHVTDQATYKKYSANNTGHQEVNKILKWLNNILPDPLLQITKKMMLLEKINSYPRFI